MSKRLDPDELRAEVEAHEARLAGPLWAKEYDGDRWTDALGREVRETSPRVLAVKYGGVASLQPQIVLMSRKTFPSFVGAVEWAAAHGYRTEIGEMTPEYIHFRQREPGQFVDGLFRTKLLSNGVAIRSGYPLRDKATYQHGSQAQIAADLSEGRWIAENATRFSEEEDHTQSEDPESDRDAAIAATLGERQVFPLLSNMLAQGGKRSTITAIRKLRHLRPDLKDSIDSAVSRMRLTKAEQKRELLEIDHTWKTVIGPRLDSGSVRGLLVASAEKGLLRVVAARILEARPDLADDVLIVMSEFE